MSHRLTRGSAPGRARDASQRPGSFEKGHKKVGGRKRGTPNVMTRERKEALLQAASQAGGEDGLVGYLKLLALNHPKTFCRLLGALL
jgi:hypothetical protein